MMPSELYDPASSRQKFSKENSDIRMLYKNIAASESEKQTMRTSMNSFFSNPLAVTTGAELFKQTPVT